jgi:hypothetical protein
MSEKNTLKKRLGLISMISIASGAVIGGWLAEAPYWFSLTGAGSALIFPLLAKWGRKNPVGTFASMAAAALLFRSWGVWSMKDYNMVVNQLINFLDVYAMGMAASLLYVNLTTLYPADRKRFIWQAAATLGVILAIWGLKELLQNQAGSSGQPAIQAGQMIRRPAFAALLALLTLSLLKTARPGSAG